MCHHMDMTCWMPCHRWMNRKWTEAHGNNYTVIEFWLDIRWVMHYSNSGQSLKRKFFIEHVNNIPQKENHICQQNKTIYSELFSVGCYLSLKVFLSKYISLTLGWALWFITNSRDFLFPWVKIIHQYLQALWMEILL